MHTPFVYFHTQNSEMQLISNDVMNVPLHITPDGSAAHIYILTMDQFSHP